MKRFDQINVIPFIDIMLVLLAIVLTTATFISQGRLDIDLPGATASTSVPDEFPLIHLAIDQHEVLFYEAGPVSLDALKTQLLSLGKDIRIVLSVDQAVPFQRFVEVIDLLKQQHIEHLSIVTEKRQ